jgi:hypothetical protein
MFLGIIFIVIIACTPIWIYFDATKNKVGKTENDKSFFNISAGAWATASLLFWIIAFPLYLIKRRHLIEKAKEFPVEVKGRAVKMVLLIIVGCLFGMVFTAGIISDSRTSNQRAETNNKEAAAVSENISFDVSNKVVPINGNIAVAVQKIHSAGSRSVWDSSEAITAEALTKSPYSSIGKLRKLTGKVYKVEELPPGDFSGHWSELLLLTRNPNSPLGTTTINFIYNGDISNIRSGQIMTCAGYFAGSFESENAMGGKVEAVVLVGNDIRGK